MTEYLRKTFSVAIQGKPRDPATCSHGWRRPNGRCWHCNTMLLLEPPPEPEIPADE